MHTENHHSGHYSSAAAPASAAEFRVMPKADFIHLEQRISETASHAVRGILYAESGLLDDAEKEFQTHLEETPDDERVKALLRTVRDRGVILKPTYRHRPTRQIQASSKASSCSTDRGSFPVLPAARLLPSRHLIPSRSSPCEKRAWIAWCFARVVAIDSPPSSARLPRRAPRSCRSFVPRHQLGLLRYHRRTTQPFRP